MVSEVVVEDRLQITVLIKDLEAVGVADVGSSFVV